MLGSTSTYFKKPNSVLLKNRKVLKKYLKIKGYTTNEISIYLDAYDYFSVKIDEFDGATILKDLIDFQGLDLDAMLHDYHYIAYKSATNFITKWKADLIYAKGQERKGKGQYSAYSRFIALTIVGIVFVPYAISKTGWMNTYYREKIYGDYAKLIR